MVDEMIAVYWDLVRSDDPTISRGWLDHAST